MSPTRQRRARCCVRWLAPSGTRSRPRHPLSPARGQTLKEPWSLDSEPCSQEKIPYEDKSKAARQAAIEERDRAVAGSPPAVAVETSSKPPSKPKAAKKPRGPVKRTPYECFLVEFREEYRSRETQPGEVAEPYDEKKMRAVAKERWDSMLEEVGVALDSLSRAHTHKHACTHTHTSTRTHTVGLGL